MNLQPLVHTRVEKEKTEHGWKKNRVDEGAAGRVWTLTAALAALAVHRPAHRPQPSAGSARRSVLLGKLRLASCYVGRLEHWR